MTHHVEMDWDNTHVSRFMERLASLSRLLVFDKRGTGMSDRAAGLPTLETRMDDIRAVMDAADSERAVLFAAGDSVRSASFSQQRTPSGPRLGFPRRSCRPETQSGCERRRHTLLRACIPTERESGGGCGLHADELEVDVSDVLPTIRVPTLILHRTGFPVFDVRVSRYMAERIPGARLAELPGRDFATSLGDQERLFDELARRDLQRAARRRRETERYLPLKRPTSRAARPRSPCPASPTKRATASSVRPRQRREAIPPSGDRA